MAKKHTGLIVIGAAAVLGVGGFFAYKALASGPASGGATPTPTPPTTLDTTTKDAIATVWQAQDKTTPAGVNVIKSISFYKISRPKEAAYFAQAARAQGVTAAEDAALREMGY
jgi:hypothetical protein